MDANISKMKIYNYLVQITNKENNVLQSVQKIMHIQKQKMIMYVIINVNIIN